METKVTKKRQPTDFQVLSNLQKKMETIQAKNIPTVKEASNMRSVTLAMAFLKNQADATKEPETITNFCLKNKISQNTLRKALKNITGETKVKPKETSNNIGSYQKQRKAVTTKVLLSGEESLTSEEKELLAKIRASEAKRAETIAKKKSTNKNINSTSLEQTKTTSDSLNSLKVTSNKKYKKLKDEIGGGKQNEQEEDSEDSEDESGLKKNTPSVQSTRKMV